ncbi:MAG TPA: dTMP kinase [Rhabdochlamydiaceae bacterium]|jgi:dTMP kinase
MQQQKRARAQFITFEGGDGAGKTTLIEKIYYYLVQEGLRVLQTRAPGGTFIGAEIRQLLLAKQKTPMFARCELFLFLADRAQHVDECIRPALEKQHIVLCDRYNDSTLAYQGSARGFDTSWLRKLLDFACDDLDPDLTIYLDLDPEVGFARTVKQRGRKDRIESEDLLFHKKIRNAFRQIARKEPRRFFMIDATLPPEKVFERAKKKIDELLGITRQ